MLHPALFHELEGLSGYFLLPPLPLLPLPRPLKPNILLSFFSCSRFDLSFAAFFSAVCVPNPFWGRRETCKWRGGEGNRGGRGGNGYSIDIKNNTTGGRRTWHRRQTYMHEATLIPSGANDRETRPSKAQGSHIVHDIPPLILDAHSTKPFVLEAMRRGPSMTMEVL